MVKDGNYHVLLGFPPSVKLPSFVIRPDYSGGHVREVIAERNLKNLPRQINLSSPMVNTFEITMRYGRIWKFGIRIPYTDKDDLCIVIQPLTDHVHTMWLNSVSDDHKTLRLENYLTPNGDYADLHYVVVNGKLQKKPTPKKLKSHW